MGDNFDKKYCDAPDKIGEETQERYEKHLREETQKQIFKDFTYFSQEDETKKEQQNQEKRGFSNPHSELSPETELKVKPMERTNSSLSIEQKMNRFKKQPTSASTSSLLKQYRVNSNLSNNSTGSSLSLNQMKKSGGTSSSVNFHSNMNNIN